MALLDTACTKTLVHPRCGTQIPYITASDKEIYFPAEHVVLEVEGKTTTIPVGVSENMNEDMLMGRDSPHFRPYPKNVLDNEPEVEEVDTPPASAPTESGMVVTRSQKLQQDALEEEERLQQERNGPIMSTLYSDDGVRRRVLKQRPPFLSRTI